MGLWRGLTRTQLESLHRCPGPLPGFAEGNEWGRKETERAREGKGQGGSQEGIKGREKRGGKITPPSKISG